MTALQQLGRTQLEESIVQTAQGELSTLFMTKFNLPAQPVRKVYPPPHPHAACISWLYGVLTVWCADRMVR